MQIIDVIEAIHTLEKGVKKDFVLQNPVNISDFKTLYLSLRMRKINSILKIEKNIVSLTII